MLSNNEEHTPLFDTGRDTDVSVKGMSEKEIKDVAKRIKVLMKSPMLKPADTVPDKITRLTTPVDLSRFDQTLKKTVQ